jgi:PhnB protein
MTLRLTPYLVMEGNAKEAIAFYEQALDAKVLFQQSFGEMPSDPQNPMPEEIKDRITHAMVKIGESDLMFSDTFPGAPVQSGNQVTICITTDNADKSKQIFDALKTGGQVVMELQETFFSPAYSQVTDKFGVNFQIFTEGKQ